MRNCCFPKRNNSNDSRKHNHDEKKTKIEIFPSFDETCFVKVTDETTFLGTDKKNGYLMDFETPRVKVKLNNHFLMSKYAVKNNEFSNFVKETNYVTDAEKYGWSFVFLNQLTKNEKSLVTDVVQETPWWCVVEGASWKHPFGISSDIFNIMDHPVVHVSWNDACAYCDWSGMSLPSESEWEHVARDSEKDLIYPWGNKLEPDGKHMCNVWQGSFPVENTEEDGYFGTAPVNAYSPYKNGVFNMIGNVWEWTSTSFINPDKTNTIMNQEDLIVLKGGSFLCHASYCNRYRIPARIGNGKDSSASNIGFRVKKDLHLI